MDTTEFDADDLGVSPTPDSVEGPDADSAGDASTEPPADSVAPEDVQEPVDLVQSSEVSDVTDVPPDDTVIAIDSLGQPDDVTADTVEPSEVEEADVGPADVDVDAGTASDAESPEVMDLADAAPIDADPMADVEQPPTDVGPVDPCLVAGLGPCDDGDPCTEDVCPASGECTHAAISGCCTTDGQCPSGDPCSVPRCDAGTCGFALAEVGASCDDGVFCTVNDTCNSTGSCIGEARPDGWRDSDDGQVCADRLCLSGATAIVPWPECKGYLAPDGSCYVVATAGHDVGWLEAQAVCDDVGMHLVTINNLGNATFVRTLTQDHCDASADYSTVWVGLGRLSPSGDLEQPGDPDGTTFWDVGQPDLTKSCPDGRVYVYATNFGKGPWYTGCEFDQPVRCVVCESRDSPACHDNDPCTANAPCIIGDGVKCVAPITLDCDDGNPSTADSCEPGVGCVHTP